MQNSLRVTYRNITPSPALTERIQERADGLDFYFGDIIGCKVVVEEQNRNQNKGRLFSVRIDCTVPGHEVVVSHDGPEDPSHEDPYVAVRDAFDALERRLEVHIERRRDAKRH
ncbi:HPF/RaiA family ribosome-associated protein [Myxococcota bacterium]|nr:HPF/RaiA family ribosome-associated protein [Myxococcota bacterium]